MTRWKGSEDNDHIKEEMMHKMLNGIQSVFPRLDEATIQ